MMARLLFTMSVVFGFGSVANAQCPPAPVDCAARARAFETELNDLKREHPGVVSEALETLRLRRRAVCHGRNACHHDDAYMHSFESWAQGELRTLRAARDNAARMGWARNLGARLQPTPSPAAPAQAQRREPTPQILAQLVTTRSSIEAIDQFTPLLAEVEQGAVVSDQPTPPAVCNPRLSARLRELVRSGHEEVSGYADSLRDLIERFCRPYQRWRTPDDAAQGSQLRFVASLDRIDGWMRDLGQCLQTGPYNFRCENTYGAREPNMMDGVRATQQWVARMRRVVRPNRPFPCRHGIWSQIDTAQWPDQRSRRHITGLATAARRHCERLGVDPESLQEHAQLLKDRIESYRATLVSRKRSFQQLLEQMRVFWRF